MRTLIFSIIAIFIAASCNEEKNITPTVPVDDDFDPMEMGATLIKEGTLMGGRTLSVRQCKSLR